eukprot:883907-Pleurochrysis_carterae.AAC.2
MSTRASYALSAHAYAYVRPESCACACALMSSAFARATTASARSSTRIAQRPSDAAATDGPARDGWGAG